ncbi:MAG: hypothetical protein VZQ84_01615 [Anaerovoracaceae bacterium]|nr:hypothetical protein [Anaerovoracaceae bacterium]
MACFLVSAGEALVVTAIEKGVESKEEKEMKETAEKAEETYRIPFSRKLHWLTNMLWGGALLLCFEHIWHGEVVPWFPFLTAAENPADTAAMLHEMSTIGVTMACIITVVWVVMVAVTKAMENRQIKLASGPEAVKEGK